MGGDGQALTNKRTLLERSRAYVTSVSDEAAQRACTTTSPSVQLTHCALSLTPLEAPVAFDLAGQLYNKRAVVEHLLALRKAAAAARDVDDKTATTRNDISGEALRKMSDVCEVHEDSVTTDDGGGVVVRCPLMHRIASRGAAAFVGLWSCGHVVSAAVQSPPRDIDGKRNSGDKDDEDEGKCVVCGVRSLIVRLALPDAEARHTQRRRLRAHLRTQRKRTRAHDEDA